MAKWLPALAHGFEPAAGALVTPRLRLIRRVADERPGSVWVADHLALATPVEVTFAEVEPGAPPEAQASALALRAQSFQSQAEVTARVNEPHLVSIIEQGDVRGLPFIVTELLEGKGLRQRLLHGPAKLADVQTLVLQASGALSKAHAIGVSHGRLRPDYLYLTELAQKPFLKLAGFGELSDGADAASQHAYASPEQLLLGTGSDARADLWAFAVALYELLTTTLPFEASTPAGVSVAICNAEFSRPTHYRADLPPAVDAWFARALAKDPAQRFADATELSRSFMAALANEAPSLPAPAPSVSLAPPPGLPLPSFPRPQGFPPPFPPSPSSRPSAIEPRSSAELEDVPLELADGEDDEMTVRWEVAEEGSPPAGGEGASAPASQLAAVALPSLATRLPILPLPAPLSPAALSSVALPSTSSQRASAGPLGAPPSLEPSVYLDSPYIASVASALAVPILPVAAPEPPPPSPRFMPFTADKTWLAAVAFAAGVAVTWFTYDPRPEEDAGAELAAASEPSVIRTLSVDDLPRAPGEEAELPKIVRTSQLQPVADEPQGAPPAAPSAPAVLERRAAPVQRVQALAPAPARAKPQPRSAPAPEAARGNCSPPYYVDERGIQRVKAGCLNGSGMIAGPYGAAVPARAKPAAAPAQPAPASKPASTGKASASDCNPPYYFEGNIRRLKLECL